MSNGMIHSTLYEFQFSYFDNDPSIVLLVVFCCFVCMFYRLHLFYLSAVSYLWYRMVYSYLLSYQFDEVYDPRAYELLWNRKLDATVVTPRLLMLNILKHKVWRYNSTKDS